VTSATEFTVTGVPARRTRSSAPGLTEAEVNYNRSSSAVANYTFRCGRTSPTSLRKTTVNQALQTIEPPRQTELGVAEPIVARHSAADQILVQMPASPTSRAPRKSSARRRPRVVAGRTGAVPGRGRGAHSLRNNVPPRNSDSARHLGGRTRIDAADRVLRGAPRAPPSPAASLRNARPSLDENNRPAVSFSLNNDGANKFGLFHAGQHRQDAGGGPR